MELDKNVGMKGLYRSGATSESGVNAGGWDQDGSVWRARQAQSDPGVDMSKQMARVKEETKAEEQEQVEVDEQDRWQGVFETTPTRCGCDSPQQPYASHSTVSVYGAVDGGEKG